MKQTGHDLPSLYKETSEGGLAITHNCKSHSHKANTEKPTPDIHFLYGGKQSVFPVSEKTQGT